MRLEDDPAAPRAFSDGIAAIAERIDRPIVLVGLMGAGKSTVGRKLASLLHTGFIDADEAIEDAAQLSIAEIFEQFGEEYFRDGERRVIARLIEDGAAAKGGVIATGGGAFVNDETRALILKSAIAVWIDCDIDTLVERTSRRNTRPLLRDGNPHEILSRLYAQRQPFYAKAQVRVASQSTPHHETAMAILEAIGKWL